MWIGGIEAKSATQQSQEGGDKIKCNVMWYGAAQRQRGQSKYPQKVSMLTGSWFAMCVCVGCVLHREGEEGMKWRGVGGRADRWYLLPGPNNCPLVVCKIICRTFSKLLVPQPPHDITVAMPNTYQTMRAPIYNACRSAFCLSVCLSDSLDDVLIQ